VPILDHTSESVRREERLRTDAIVWFGSVRPDGRPHLVPVWFHWDGETVLILSQPRTQKVRNLARNPFVTIAIDDSRMGQDVALFEGEATLLAEPVARARSVAYLAKYAELLAEMEWTPEQYLTDYSQGIVVRPSRFLVW
jgi:PPOX class probable F420-dependent enzyme